MSDKILVITEPDDYFDDAIRLLFVDLDSNQTKMFTKPLLDIPTEKSIVCYYWALDTSMTWLLDKLAKSHLIFFNNDSSHRELVGFLTANSKAYGLGNNRFLGKFINRNIVDSDEIKSLIIKTVGIEL